mgnify:CR=1 FL=1
MLTLSSAGSVNVDAERRITWHKPEHRSAYKFVVKDLHGGHSGEAINCGYANAVKIIAQAINSIMKKQKLNLQVSEFKSKKCNSI